MAAAEGVPCWGTLPDGVRTWVPTLHSDPRGSVREAWRAADLPAAVVQENQTWSRRGAVRGLHLQTGLQAKLVRVLVGAVFDVLVDLRPGPAFGTCGAVPLDAAGGLQLWVPAGVAHGFCVTSDEALVVYGLTATWDPARERTLRWDDPDLAIPWPLDGPAVVSDKDALGTPLAGMAPWEAR